MKKLLRFTLVSLLAVFCGTAFAADPYKVLTFPDDNNENNKVGAYNKEWTAMMGSDSWTITSFNNNNWNNWTYIRCGWKTEATVASIATDFAIDQPVSTVVVTFDKLSSVNQINSISLVMASDADFTDVVETVSAPNMEAGDMAFNIAVPKANCYYKLVVDCQKTSSNGTVQISKLAYYKSGDNPDIVDISNTPETAYTVEKAHELIYAGEGLATSVYVKGVITGVGEFNSQYGQVTYYINDADGVEDDLEIYGGLYLGGEKFTSADQIKEGDEVIVYGQLQDYNGKHEMNYGNYIYSLNGKTEPDEPVVDVVECENIAAVKAQKAGTLVSLTLKDAQVVYVNSYTSGDYTNVEYFVRDASGAIDFYNTGLELKTNDVLNGVVVFEYSPYNEMPELVKTDETNSDNLTVTAGEEAQPVEFTDIAELQTDKYLCDFVKIKGAMVTSEKDGDYTNYYAVDVNDSKVMLYDKFKLSVTLPTDGEKYDITGIMGTANLSGEIVNELFLLDVENSVPSGIDNVIVEDEFDENAPVYNLAGQRVSKDAKGIVIQNGKKFVRK